MFNKRGFTVCLLAISLLSGGWAQAQEADSGEQEAYLDELAVSKSQQDVLISASLKKIPWQAEIYEVVKSGVQTSFLFQVELHRQRDWWWDELIMSQEIVQSVQYDTLSKQYKLIRQIGEDSQTSNTQELNQVLSWMCKLEGIKLLPISQLLPEESYYISLKAQMDSFKPPFFPLNYLLFFFPFRQFETPWLSSEPFKIPALPTSAKKQVN